MNKIRFWFLLLSLTVFFTACGGDGNGSEENPPALTATVVIQLQDAGNADYHVDGMTVSVQKDGGTILTGVTGTDGIARITVSETGTYNVLKVDGVDASGLAEGSDAGREFVKSNPIEDPYPNITYTLSGITVSVTSDGGYPVNVSVPTINKVTVLATGSLVTPTDGNGQAKACAGTDDFAGRVMMSDFYSDDENCSIGIWSNDSNENRLVLYAGTTDILGGYFYGGNPLTGTSIGSISSYTLDRPVYFEAPGTESGDWALGCNLSAADIITRDDLGGEDSKFNFPGFDGDNGGIDDYIFNLNPTSGGTGHNYSFDYRIFRFDTY